MKCDRCGVNSDKLYYQPAYGYLCRACYVGYNIYIPGPCVVKLPPPITSKEELERIRKENDIFVVIE